MLNKKKKASNGDSQSGKKTVEVIASLLEDPLDTIHKGVMAGLSNYVQKNPTIWVISCAVGIFGHGLKTMWVTDEENKAKEGIVDEGNFNLSDPTKNFTGRTKELEKIHQLLNDQSRVLVSISGLGGIGKTQLALKYARLYAKDYGNNVVWVDAENPFDSFKKLAGNSRINIRTKDTNGRDKEDKDIAQEVYAHFKGKKSLFIFDNAKSPEEIKNFLPSLDYKTHILITSKHQNWKDVAGEISLNGFSNEEARNFVKKELNIVTIEDINKLMSEINVPKDFQLILKKDDVQKGIEKLKGKTNALDKWLEKLKESLLQGEEQYCTPEPEELVKTLKDLSQFLKRDLNITNNGTIEKLNQMLGLPLALQQAVAYIKQQKTVDSDFGVEDYLEEYHSCYKAAENLLSFNFNRYDNDPYAKTIMATLQTTLDKIKRDEQFGDEAIRILNIMAYLAPDDIPNEIFSKLVTDRKKLADAIDLLKNYSMISQGKKSDSSNVHRLVQEVIRIKLKKQNVEEEVLSDMLKINPSNEQKSAMRCSSGMTFLHLAAYIGHSGIVTNLLDRGADVDVEDECGETPLYLAVIEGHVEVVEALLNRGADVDVISYDRWTPLHIAAEYSLRITTLLVDKNANISAKNDNGETPLDLASKCGNTEIVKLLRKKQSEYNYALLAAVNSEDINEIINLLNKGADVNVKYSDGMTILHIAADIGWVNVVKALLDPGANANISAKNDHGETPLDLASKCGNTEIVKLLREKQSEYNYALLAAVNSEDINEIINLLNKGADANVKYSDGMTILHIAAYIGWVDVVKALLDQGANVDAASHRLDFKGLTPLHFALVKGHLEIIEALLNQGANVDAQDEHGLAPLHIAAAKGSLDVVKVLLDQKANVNVVVRKLDFKRLTPLHMAIMNGHLDVVKTLLNRVEDVDAQDEHGLTPLHFAIVKGHLEIIKVLLDQGANVDAQNEYGLTPLHIAAQSSLRITTLLVDKNANISAKNDHGETPLDLASECGNKEIVEFLREKQSESDWEMVDSNDLSDTANDYSHSSSSRSVLDNPSVTALHNVSHIKNK